MAKNIGNELETILREATSSVEAELGLEDAGWINLSNTGEIIGDSTRKENVKLSRLYYLKDPLAKQSIRLWTDYSFGTGMSWKAKEENTQKVLESFWNAPENQNVLSCRGQRKSSDKTLVDGEIFYALFLGSSSTVTKIRTVNPLEITEIITDPDDKDDVRYYKREWTDTAGRGHISCYRDVSNIKDESTLDSLGQPISKTEDALIYHLAINTISQRGNPLLLPALDWIKQYRRFLASRIAVMLALARFAWKTKVKGDATAVAASKATVDDKEIDAGSWIKENLGSDTTPIKTESGASAAYQDARMIKLQICSASGWPEQYFGDLATGNLATAKTVELPVAKMCQSYQAVWADAYKDINEIVLFNANVPPDKWYVDMDFPAIAPEDYTAMATSIQQIVQTMPELGYSDDVIQQALLAIGVNNPGEVIETLNKQKESNPELKLAKVLKQFKESVKINKEK